jgi:hypothetical protein
MKMFAAHGTATPSRARSVPSLSCVRLAPKPVGGVLLYVSQGATLVMASALEVSRGQVSRFSQSSLTAGKDRRPARVAQSVERWLEESGVDGSTPFPSTSSFASHGASPTAARGSLRIIRARSALRLGGAVVARRAHNPKVAGSNPARDPEYLRGASAVRGCLKGASSSSPQETDKRSLTARKDPQRAEVVSTADARQCSRVVVTRNRRARVAGVCRGWLFPFSVVARFDSARVRRSAERPGGQHGFQIRARGVRIPGAAPLRLRRKGAFCALELTDHRAYARWDAPAAEAVGLGL